MVRAQNNRDAEILLIEGNPADADHIREMLTGHSDILSFNLKHIDRSLSALEQLSKAEPDLVLLSLGSPDGPGLDVLGSIYEKYPNMPVILLADSADSKLADEAREIGVIDCLAKGQLDGNLLVRAIHYAIDWTRCLAEASQYVRESQSTELRLWRIIESSSVGIAVVAKAGTVRFINPAAESILGKDPDTIIGQPFEFPLALGQNTEVVCNHPNGKTITAEMSVTETEWDKEQAWLVSLHDITERKIAEDAEKELAQIREQQRQRLEESETRLRQIIEKIVDGIVIVDQEENVCFANPSAGLLLGQKADELEGEQFGFPTPTGESTEVEIISPDGEKGVIEVRIAEMEWLGQTAKLISLHDITERKHAEETEKKLVEIKDELIASVSHELRTPLFSIRGFLELLRDGKVKDPETQQEFLTRASQDANRLTLLVNDLLDVSRLEAGRMELELEEVELDTLIRETLESLQNQAQQKEIAPSYSGAEMPLKLKADRRRLRQVLTNFVTNAIKFSEAHCPIRVTAELIEDLVRVKVIDQGVGISAEDIPHLFDMFYQANGSGKRAGGGAGLGLHIAKKIIESHGGQIGVESAPGMGSTFFFILPVSADKKSRVDGPRVLIKNER